MKTAKVEEREWSKTRQTSVNNSESPIKKIRTNSEILKRALTKLSLGKSWKSARNDKLDPMRSSFNMEDYLLSHREARRFLFPEMEDMNFGEEQGVNWNTFSRLLLRSSVDTITQKMGSIKRKF